MAPSQTPTLTARAPLGGMPDSVFNVEAAILNFVGNEAQTTLELPRMTAAERKQAKKLAEKYPDLKFESFGFGEQRRMNLFKTKQAGELHQAVSKLDFSKLSQSSPGIDPGSVSNSSRSTTASEVQSTSFDSTSASSSSGALDLLEPAYVPVDKTFIHFTEDPADERVIQSMPHNMFRQQLWEEYTKAELAAHIGAPPGLISPAVNQGPDVEKVSHAEDRSETTMDSMTSELNTTPGCCSGIDSGMEVVIGGLLTTPQFNGLRGTVHSSDPKTGYCIISVPAPCGQQKVKVQAANLWVVRPSPPPGLECNFYSSDSSTAKLEKRASVLATTPLAPTRTVQSSAIASAPLPMSQHLDSVTNAGDLQGLAHQSNAQTSLLQSLGLVKETTPAPAVTRQNSAVAGDAVSSSQKPGPVLSTTNSPGGAPGSNSQASLLQSLGLVEAASVAPLRRKQSSVTASNSLSSSQKSESILETPDLPGGTPEASSQMSLLQNLGLTNATTVVPERTMQRSVTGSEALSGSQNRGSGSKSLDLAGSPPESKSQMSLSQSLGLAKTATLTPSRKMQSSAPVSDGISRSQKHNSNSDMLNMSGVAPDSSSQMMLLQTLGLDKTSTLAPSRNMQNPRKPSMAGSSSQKPKSGSNTLDSPGLASGSGSQMLVLQTLGLAKPTNLKLEGLV